MLPPLESLPKYEWDVQENKYLPATGRPGADTIHWTGNTWIMGEPNPEGPGALSRGLATGMAGIKGAVVDLLPAMAQSAFGYDDAARKNLEEYAQRFKDLESTGYLARTQFGDIKDVDSFLSWFGETLGQAATSMIPVAGGAGAGAVLGGRLLAGAASRATGPVATTLTRDALKKTTEALIARGMPANEAAGIATRNLAQMAGATGGAFAGGWIQNAPESFKEIFDETGEMRPGIAAGLGTIKSALDTVGPIALLSKIKGAQFADQVKSRIASKLLEGRPGVAGALGGMLGGLATEGITEGSQALVDELALAALNDKSIDWNKILENFAAGAALGTVVGGIGGAITARREAQAVAQLQEVRAAEAQAKADATAKAEAEAQAEAQAKEAETQANLEYQSQFENLIAPTPAPRTLTPEELRAETLRRTQAQFPNVPFFESGDIDYKTLQANLRAEFSKLPEFERPSVPKTVKNLKDEIYKAYAQNKAQIEESNRRQVEVAARAAAPAESLATKDQELVDKVNQDPSILEADPALNAEYREAVARMRSRADEAKAAAEADRETLQNLGFAPFPSRGTSVEIQRPEPSPALAVSEVAEPPSPLTREQRRNLEDLLGALEPGGRVSIPAVQKALALDGRPATISEAREALSDYAPARPQTSIGMDKVPAQYRLVRRGDVFSKPAKGAVSEPRPEASETPSPLRGGRGFEGTTPATETIYPVFGPRRMGQRFANPMDAATNFAQNLPPGAKFNQAVLAQHLQSEGFRDIPRQTVAKLEKAIRVAHPTLFEKGIKVASRDVQAEEKAAPPQAESTLQEMANPTKMNVPPDSAPEVVEQAEKFAAESKKDSDSKDLLDKPYTCRI